jgi:hypothetical protein
MPTPGSQDPGFFYGRDKFRNSDPQRIAIRLASRIANTIALISDTVDKWENA